jgi:hypothetical protein
MAKTIPPEQDAGGRSYLDECARTNRMLCIAIALIVVLCAAGAHLAYLAMK